MNETDNTTPPRLPSAACRIPEPTSLQDQDTEGEALVLLARSKLTRFPWPRFPALQWRLDVWCFLRLGPCTRVVGFL